MKRQNFFAPSNPFQDLEHRALVLEGPDRSKPAVFEGTNTEVHNWVLTNIMPSENHLFTIYMDEIMSYMSVPHFLEKTTKTHCRTGVYALSEKIPGEENSEKVNHPSHYNTGKIEVIDAIEDWKLGFNAGNAVKYIARAPHKGKNVEDLKKAAWYIAREIARLEGAIEEEAPKKGFRKIGSFGTGDDATLFIQSSGPKFSANQTHNLRLKVGEARKIGKCAVMVVENENDMGMYVWLSNEYPYGEIWLAE